jgi:hypothetical protein
VHGLLRGFALVGRHIFYRGAIPIFRQADIHQCKGRYYVLKECRDGCEYPIMPRTYEQLLHNAECDVEDLKI